MGLFGKLKGKRKDHGDSSSDSSRHPSPQLPPDWAPAPETSHTHGLYNEAPDDEYQSAEDFCERYPVDRPRLLPSHAIDDIQHFGSQVWTMDRPSASSPRFVGTISGGGIISAGGGGGGGGKSQLNGADGCTTIRTMSQCKSVCLLSNLPILAGLYDVPRGKAGVYYEVLIKKMSGIVSIGTSCRPYPEWRHPGWNRLSAALHLDDLRKFSEDPDGGRDYETNRVLRRIEPNDTIGCGYEFSSCSIFFTYNGIRLPNAFSGLYLPRTSYDVFAAIGVEGPGENEIQVNFGAGELFRWKEGNEWAWRVEAHIGRMAGGSSEYDEELPAY